MNSKQNRSVQDKKTDSVTSQLIIARMTSDNFSLNELGGGRINAQLNHSENLFGFIIATNGMLELEINGRNTVLSPGEFVCISPGVSFKILSGNTEFEGYMLTFSPLFLESLHLPKSINCKLHFINYDRHNTTAAIFTRAKQLLCLIKNETENAEHFYSREIIQNLVSAFYLDIFNAQLKDNCPAQLFNQSATTFRAKELCKNFILLVKQYASEQRQVCYYADKLCITPQYLSTLVKATTGLTANEWIKDSVVNMAKHLIQTSGNSTIKEISYALNFSNPSFFGKYFKKAVGISPIEYQKTLLVDGFKI